jgi:F-type H+-transporting ATPase subunit alpha
MKDDPQTKKDTMTHFDVREVGRIKSVRKFLVTATGLPSCINGQIVEFQQGGLGMVVGFTEDEVQILVLGLNVHLRTGDEVYNRAQSLSLPAGDAFLGRMVNGLCEPVDGMGPIAGSAHYPVFGDAPAVLDRIPVEETLETGTLALDNVIPIAKGQRQLLIGDRLSGKTTVAVDAMINQRGKDVVCIYCCVGKPFSSLVKILTLFREKDVMPYSIVVSAVSSTSVGEQYIAPYTACMLGEYFMHKGKDVLVIFDDLTKHAWIYRQISLLLERAPGREAYPGDIFYVHSQLVERAGYLKPELGGGSMTFFPIVETLQGDLTGYIPTNIISMTDGQIYFNTALFYKGIKPAIDFGLSVSRIGNKAQWPVMRQVSKNLRLDYLRYQELLQMTRLRATGLSQEAQARLKRGEVITQLICQDKNDPVAIEQQVTYLYALNASMLDGLSPQQVKKFKAEIFTYVNSVHPDLYGEIRSSQKLSEENQHKLETALKRYFDEWQR